MQYDHETPSQEELDALEQYLKAQDKSFVLVDHILAVAQYMIIGAMILIVWFAFN